MSSAHVVSINRPDRRAITSLEEKEKVMSNSLRCGFPLSLALLLSLVVVHCCCPFLLSVVIVHCHCVLSLSIVIVCCLCPLSLSLWLALYELERWLAGLPPPFHWLDVDFCQPFPPIEQRLGALQRLRGEVVHLTPARGHLQRKAGLVWNE